MKTFLTIIVSLIIISLAIIWYSGAFASIKVFETVEGGYFVAGHEFTGSYSKTGKFISEVDAKLKELGVNCSKGFGIYYDDPKTTPEEKCKSFVGDIIENKDISKIPELKSAGFKVDSIPKSKAIAAEFPARTFLSYMIGPVKVYPMLSKYLIKNNYKATYSLEIYNMTEQKITFIMLLNDK